MAWVISTDGTLTHSGTTAESYVLPGVAGQGYAIEVDLLSTDHFVGLMVLASDDARNGWMAGVFDDTSADSAKLTLRRIVDGVIATPTTGGDAPNDATPVAHGLSTNLPFTLRVEVIDGRLIVSMRGALVSGSVQLAYLNDTAPTFLANQRIAVWSKTNNARVIAVRVIPAVFRTSDEREILFWATGGDVWACYDGETAELIARGVVPADTLLPCAVMNGQGFIAGGGVIKVFDPQARTVEPFVPTAGSLPGTRGGGSFDVIGAADFKTRVYWVMRAGVIASAVNDPYDVDTGAYGVEGSAFDLRASNRQDFGSDVVSVVKANDDTLMFGTTTAIFSTAGDPIDGTLRQLPVTLDSGPSAWYAMIPVDAGGRSMAHTPDGMLIFSAVEGGYNFSRATIREGVNIPADKRGRVWVTSVRDPSRGYLWVFQTNQAAQAGIDNLPAPGLHWVYDEAAGGYQNGSLGFFPQAFAQARIDPTRAVNWRGRVILGCADGYLRVFDDASVTDRVTTNSTLPIDAKCEFGVVDAPGVLSGVMLNWIRPELSTTSGNVRATVYGADGVAKLFDAAHRKQMWAGDWVDGEVMLVRQQANAISVRVSAGTQTGTPARWSIEQVEADIDAVSARRRFAAGVNATLPTIPRPTKALPAPAGPTPPDPFGDCGSDVNPDPDPTPTGVIASIAYGTLTATGQFIQPTVVVSDATGPFTYNWSVDGVSGAWSSGDDSATPPNIELTAGYKTLRVIITGGSLRVPLEVTRTVLVSKTGGTDRETLPGDGADGTTTTYETEESTVFSEAVGPAYEALAAPPGGSCSVNTNTPPAPPAGYGGGTYASGGFP